MAKSAKQSKSLFFPIVISSLVLVMLIIVVVTIISSKEEKKKAAGKQTSSSFSVVPASVNGTIGLDKLTPFTDEVAKGTDPDIGKIVPKIVTRDFDDKEVTIEPGKKPYAIAFLAHWCSHCQREVPKLVELKSSGQIPDNVEIVAVATGTDKSRVNYPPSTWLETENWPWRVAADTSESEIGSKLGVVGYPYVIYVNADGTIFKRTSGEQDTASIVTNINAIAASSK